MGTWSKENHACDTAESWTEERDVCDPGFSLLQEDGCYLLQEDSFKIGLLSILAQWSKSTKTAVSSWTSSIKPS